MKCAFPGCPIAKDMTEVEYYMHLQTFHGYDYITANRIIERELGGESK